MQNMQASRDMSDDDLDEDREDYESQAGQGVRPEQPQPVSAGDARPVNLEAAPQPVIEGTPAEVALNADQDGDGGRRQDRHQQAGGSDFEGGHRRARRPRRGGHRPGLNGDTPETGDQSSDESAESAADGSDPALLGADS
jgi:hypothetical protein